MADLKYNSFKQEILKGTHDFDTDAFNLMLVTSAYTPLATHSKRSDVTNEVVGTGYSAGGQAVANLATSIVGTAGTVDGDNVTWSSSTITARAAVLYRARGGAASADELVAYFDFGSDQSSSNGDFTAQINASGILDVD